MQAILKKTERAYFANGYAGQKRFHIGSKADWMFDACSAQMDSTFKPLLAGIKPPTTHEAHPKM
jgi:hypothetical protein